MSNACARRFNRNNERKNNQHRHVETFLTATALVAVAEIGDKTQLLSFMLAARLKHRSAIIWGILIATVLNHALAAAAARSWRNNGYRSGAG